MNAASFPDSSPLPLIPAVIKPRDPKTASTLAKLAPGLGHIYAGDLRRGLLVLGGVDLSMAAGALLLASPWSHLPTVFSFWGFAIGLSIWSVFDVRKVVRSTRSDYRLKDYNHWTAYLGLGFLPSTILAVGVAVVLLTTTTQSLIAASDLPSIGVSQGDRYVEWKSAYRDQKPAVGDLIAYRGPLGSSGRKILGRISGLPGDTLTTADGQTITIPPGSLAVTPSAADRTTGHEIISEMALTGKLLCRYWPLSQAGAP